MEKQKRDVLFSVLLVVVTGFVFFSLGLAAAWKFGFAQHKTVIEYVPSATDNPYTMTTSIMGKLDLNTATAEELMRIEGVGEKTARRIIAYREEIGGFRFIEQLMDIEGIGEKKFSNWSAYLTVGSKSAASDTTTATIVLNTSAKTTVTSHTPTSTTAAPTTSTTAFSGVLNINRATKEELMLIKGIGEITAQKIIDYRNLIGGFKSLEQLLDIDGIGEKKLAAWRPYLTLDD